MIDKCEQHPAALERRIDVHKRRAGTFEIPRRLARKGFDHAHPLFEFACEAGGDEARRALAKVVDDARSTYATVR